MPATYNSPCAACKHRRRRCTEDCVFAPHFPADQYEKFLVMHQAYGASNIAKIVRELSPNQRGEAFDSLVYEANARISDPVYGCVGLISLLQKRIKQLGDDLFDSKRELSTCIGTSSAFQSFLPNQQPIMDGNNPSVNAQQQPIMGGNNPSVNAQQLAAAAAGGSASEQPGTLSTYEEQQLFLLRQHQQQMQHYQLIQQRQKEVLQQQQQQQMKQFLQQHQFLQEQQHYKQQQERQQFFQQQQHHQVLQEPQHYQQFFQGQQLLEQRPGNQLLPRQQEQQEHVFFSLNSGTEVGGSGQEQDQEIFQQQQQQEQQLLRGRPVSQLVQQQEQEFFTLNSPFEAGGPLAGTRFDQLPSHGLFEDAIDDNPIGIEQAEQDNYMLDLNFLLQQQAKHDNHQLNVDLLPQPQQSQETQKLNQQKSGNEEGKTTGPS